MDHDKLMVPPGRKIKLEDYDPGYTHNFKVEQEAKEKLAEDIKHLAHHQDLLYAQASYAVLIVFQAMDAAGKDSTIKHVMSGVNPQGCQVTSFKQPSSEELRHDYLWRAVKALPERGRIGIFNRSYYEELLVPRIHPEVLEAQHLPQPVITEHIWKERYEQINNFEKYLVQNGTVILKFFLNVSKKEQKRRFLERLENPEKNWKFSATDIRERTLWDTYAGGFERVFNHTSTDFAPWYIIPADHKWFTRVAVANIIVEKLKSLDLSYPKPTEKQLRELQESKAAIEREV
ncbi:MAG TPA: polyphosphate kinase 2 family protein [Blastocatellia bacterium]|nr:polyphosphate kinase 2 family protein [Blastocatellia bacterium]